MSKKRHRSHRISTTREQQHYTQQERNKATFVRWGILAIIGGVLLFVIDIIFLYTSYFPAHPNQAQSLSVLTILQGPLIIEGLLLLFGIGALIYGLRRKSS